MILMLILMVACSTEKSLVDEKPSVDNTKIELANPASVFCEDNGGRLEIRTSSDGGQKGYCIFPDGSECEEWAFFRGECSQGGEK